MNTIDYLNSKIDELNASLNEVKQLDPKDAERINKELAKVSMYLGKLDDKKDFVTSELRKLLNDNNIVYDEKVLNEIKNNMIISNQIGFNIEYSDNQLKVLDDIRKGLLSIKKKLEDESLKLSQANNDNIKKNVEELKGLSKVVEGNGRRKYYTREMIEAFLSTMPDLNNMSLNEATSLMEGLYNTKNITGGISKQKQELSDVKEVFASYLDAEKYGIIESILDKYSDIICSYIDLYNTMDILEFFKENGLIEKFENLALVKIAVFGNTEHVQRIYERVLLEDTPDKDVFLTDTTATLWVSDGIKRRKRPFRVTRGARNKDDDFYESCHRATYDEYKENIEFLRENSEAFSENFDPDNIGAHLDVTTDSKKKSLGEILMNASNREKRNFNLFKTFGLDRKHSVPITSLKIGDVENKIHLAIELGLLNPPETNEFANMDALIPRNQIFVENLEKSKKEPETIRNYFARNLSVLSSLSINQYAVMAKKQKELGQLQMYREFFSEKKAGDKNPDFLTDFDKLVCQDEGEMRKLLAENFADPAIIRDYYLCDEAISEVDMDETHDNDKYFDESILDEELISNLEQKYSVATNPYIYLIDGIIVSRYKVLHNASNLKEFFKYFDENMLKVSIFRNSFFSFEEYDKIEKCIKERGLVK